MTEINNFKHQNGLVFKKHKLSTEHKSKAQNVNSVTFVS